MEKIKLGIIGIGNMGSNYATKVANGECPDFQLVAVADTNPKRLEWARENLKGSMSLFDTAEAMLDSGLTPEEVLGQVCGDLGVLFMETTPVSYKCYCSRERVTAALISLGKEELAEISDEGKPFPVECQFCDEHYVFSPEDIRQLQEHLEEE